MENLILKLIPIIFVILWSSGSIFVKIGIEESSIWSFLFLRSFLSFILLFFISKIIKKQFNKNNTNNIYKKEIIISMISGLLLNFMYQMFFFQSIKTGLSIGLISIILSINPILISAIAKEKINIKIYLMMILSLIGVTITIFGYKSVNGYNIYGIIFCILSLIVFSIGNLIQNKSKLDMITNLKIQFLCSSFLFIIPLFFYGFSVNINIKFIFSLLWMVLFVSLGASLLMLFMIKKDQINRVSSLFFCVPPVTMFFDYILFAINVSYLSIFGALLTIYMVIKFFSETSKLKSEKNIFNNFNKYKVK